MSMLSAAMAFDIRDYEFRVLQCGETGTAEPRGESNGEEALALPGHSGPDLHGGGRGGATGGGGHDGVPHSGLAAAGFCPPCLALSPGSCSTLYFFMVGDGSEFLPTPESQVVLAGPVSMESFPRIKENCAGIGGIAHGCVAGGAFVSAAMDVNKFAVRHLKRYYTGEILEGNVNSDHDLLRLHHAGGSSPAVETAPFSRQGDGVAFLDSRSQASWGVLRSAYLHQAGQSPPSTTSPPRLRAGHELAFGANQAGPVSAVANATHTMVGALSTDAAACPTALASGSYFEMAFMGTFGCRGLALHGPRARLLHEQNLWEWHSGGYP